MNIWYELIFEVFMAMKFQVVVFWVVILCSDMVGYQSLHGVIT